MGEWKRIKLSEVLKEKTERNRNNETDLVLSVTNSQGFVKQSDFFEGTVHSEDISNYKLVRKNEFAYNPSRINVGSIDILKEYDIGALSPMYVIFSVDETKLLPDYFKYYFQTHKFNENVKNKTQGSVRNSLSFKALSEFEYLLPPLEEQKRIVKILDQVNKIIEKYQNLINEKEQFIKSQFVEMFDNEFDQPKKKLSEFTSVITKGTTPTTVGFDFINTGINFIKIEALSNDEKIDKEKCLHISDECNKKLNRSQLEKNDILFSIAGTKMGIIAKVTEDVLPANTNQALAIIRLKKDEKINVDFLIELLHSPFIISQIESNKRGIAQFNVSLEDLKKLEIIAPSIEKQNYFAKIVHLIDKQKFELEKQKQNYIDLKKGLMQQLLTGKLKVS